MVVFVAVLVGNTGCNRTNSVASLPTLTTTGAVGIGITSASSGGNISDDGGAAVTARGVCWSTSSNPSVTLTTKTIDGAGSGSYTSSIAGLMPGITYHVRAYAVNSAGTAYGADLTFQTSSLHVGDSYGGGIVAYILQPGDSGYDMAVQHGLIAAPGDQANVTGWYNGSNIVTGATGTAIGTGSANTSAIVTTQGAGSYAASICKALTLSGYNDWYLPSRDELNKIYLNKIAIGGLVSGAYWSSSEVSASLVWFQDLVSGEQNGSGHKDGNAGVRATRSF